MGDTVDVKPCVIEEPPHPCDDPVPCDPLHQGHNCPEPYICLEKLKNPAWPGEITRCLSGESMPVKSCEKVEPPHPCDEKPPCSLKTEHEKRKLLQCIEPPLCLERIKNPENRPKKDPACDDTK